VQDVWGQGGEEFREQQEIADAAYGIGSIDRRGYNVDDLIACAQESAEETQYPAFV
jgi:hypothetical protein